MQSRNEIRHHLDDSNRNIKGVVNMGILKADSTGADDDYAFGHGAREVHYLIGGDDLLMVDMECRYLRRLGANGDVDILGSDDFLLLAVVDLNGVGVDKSCSALGLKAEAEIVYDAFSALVYRLEINRNGRHINVDAVCLGFLEGSIKICGGHERLGRNTTAVNAGTA